MKQVYDHSTKSGVAGSTQTFEIKARELDSLIIKQVLTGGTTPQAKHSIKIDAFTEIFNGVLVDTIPDDLARALYDAERGSQSNTATAIKYALNIGHYDLDGNESLLVTLTDQSTGVPTNVAFTVTSVKESDFQDSLLQISRTISNNNSLENVNAVVLYSTGITDAETIDYTVDGVNSNVRIINIKDLDTMLLAENGIPAGYYFLLFDEKMRVHDFRYEVKTSSAFTVYYRTVRATQKRSITSAQKKLSTKKQWLDRLFTKDVERTKGLISMGALPKPSVLDNASTFIVKNQAM